MGMFDTFLDRDGREYQSKAFGKNLTVFRIGDPAPVRRAPFNEAEYNAWLDDAWDGDPGPGADTCQVQAEDGMLLNLRDGIYTGVTRDRDPRVPLFDYHGRNITVLDAKLADPTFAAAHRQATALAWSHPTAIRGAYADRSLATDFNTAVASLVAHCAALLVAAPPPVPDPAAVTARAARARAARARGEQAAREARHAAGYGDWFDLLAADPADQQAFGALVEQTDAQTEALVRAEAGSYEDLPTSVFVLGEPEPEAPEQPQPLQQVADVFTRALAALRDTPADDGTGSGRVGPDSGDLYDLHVQAYRDAGLHVVAPGWAHTAQVLHSP